ncbi:hypothetical protein MXB_5562 [Myxobolus squamalis]|nr:hypothetical protein MXB_5562 [Myxobolus squamalis]
MNFASNILDNRFISTIGEVVSFFCERNYTDYDRNQFERAERIFGLIPEYNLIKNIESGWRWDKLNFSCKKKSDSTIYFASMCLRYKSLEENKIDREILDSLFKGINGKNYFDKLVAMSQNCKGIPLESDDIICFSNQILNGLKYLHNSGIFHGNIHCGNIIIDNGAKITDVHLTLLGYIHRDIKLFMIISNINNEFQLDILGFASVVYEMIYGTPILSSFNPPESAPQLDHCLGISKSINQEISHAYKTIAAKIIEECSENSPCTNHGA